MLDTKLCAHKYSLHNIKQTICIKSIKKIISLSYDPFPPLNAIKKFFGCSRVHFLIDKNEK